MFDWVLNTPLCSKHINNYFHQIYLSDKSDTENERVRLIDRIRQSDNVIPALQYLEYKLTTRFHQPNGM